MAQIEPPGGGEGRFCSNCGGDIPQSARFCPQCGKRTEVTPFLCAHCGATLRAGGRFCPSCGAAADLAAAQAFGTGAGTQVGVEYMGFWIRLAAAVIDGVLAGLLGAFIDVIPVVPAIGSVFSLLYYVLFTGLKGQTPGKMALRIQVVDQSGNVPGIGRAALREIIGKPGSSVVFLLGFAWIGWDRRKQGWHDHIGGTFVVRKQRDRP